MALLESRSPKCLKTAGAVIILVLRPCSTCPKPCPKSTTGHPGKIWQQNGCCGVRV